MMSCKSPSGASPKRDTARSKIAWQASAVVRLAAHVAFCRRQGTGCVEADVGGVISTDLRKLDDLRMAIEDEGLDVLSFSQSLRALASVVCSG